MPKTTSWNGPGCNSVYGDFWWVIYEPSFHSVLICLVRCSFHRLCFINGWLVPFCIFSTTPFNWLACMGYAFEPEDLSQSFWIGIYVLYTPAFGFVYRMVFINHLIGMLSNSRFSNVKLVASSSTQRSFNSPVSVTIGNIAHLFLKVAVLPKWSNIKLDKKPNFSECKDGLAWHYVIIAIVHKIYRACLHPR